MPVIAPAMATKIVYFGPLGWRFGASYCLLPAGRKKLLSGLKKILACKANC
jgi:hypothetical protein